MHGEPSWRFGHEARGLADGAVDILDAPAEIAHGVVMVVADAGLEARGRSGRVEPANEAGSAEVVEDPVDRLQGERAELCAQRGRRGEDALGRRMRVAVEQVEHGDTLACHTEPGTAQRGLPESGVAALACWVPRTRCHASMLTVLLNDSKQGHPCSKEACLCLTCQVPSASQKTPSNSNPKTNVTLDSGAQARFSRDGEEWTLIVDGTPQSAVNPLDPRELSFGYIRHMGYVLDLAFPESAGITALHLGAGALTIPRYLDATRPRSRQQVVEIDRSLVDFVREVVPIPAGASIRIRYGDAREQLGRLPRGLLGSVDAIVVDIFSGAQTPAHVTSVEFFAELEPFLRPDGVVLVNIADGHDLAFARAEVATLLEVFGEVALVGDPAMLKGRRFGNIAAVASRSADALSLPGLERRVASGFPPAVVVRGKAVREFVRGTDPARDASATASPLPGKSLFRERRQGGW